MLDKVIDYHNLSERAYYLSLEPSNRLLNMINLSFESKVKAANLIGIKGVVFSNSVFARTLQTLNKYCKPLNLNIRYIITGEDEFKYKDYREVNYNFNKLFDLYESNKYIMNCRSIPPLITNYRKNHRRISLKNIYLFSLTYNKPVWYFLEETNENVE